MNGFFLDHRRPVRQFNICCGGLQCLLFILPRKKWILRCAPHVHRHQNAIIICFLVYILGVVTFCHSSATPCAAEEGLTGVLGEGREDSVGCHAQWNDFTPEEVGSTELAPLLYPITFRLTTAHMHSSLIPRLSP